MSTLMHVISPPIRSLACHSNDDDYIFKEQLIAWTPNESDMCNLVPHSPFIYRFGDNSFLPSNDSQKDFN